MAQSIISSYGVVLICLVENKQFIWGAESCEFIVKHGVLGPFILFINDLPLRVSSQIDLYADDTTITTSSEFQQHITTGTFTEHICK